MPAPPRDEEELRLLMVRYQGADPDAVEQLVRRLSPLLFRYLAAMERYACDTEDLLQECWLRVHRARHTYRPTEPVLPWIFAIARHTRLDGYRRSRRLRSREVLFGTVPEQVTSSPAQDVGARDLVSLLKSLPDTQREVILMLKYSGMTLEEVAKATSSSVGAVKQKAHRAYKRLRRKLQDLYGESRADDRLRKIRRTTR